MLGLTSYQEALRALGRLLEPATTLRITEQRDVACVEVANNRAAYQFGPTELEEVLLASQAHRGDHRAAGPLSDVLRSVGHALDELDARDVCLELNQERLTLRFSEGRELTYAGEELEALRRSAAARRNGQPLSRVLILESAPDSAAHLHGLLVAEFAVQALPTLYARGLAAASEPPDLVLAQATQSTVAAIQTLRAGARTTDVPVLVIAATGQQVEPSLIFAAGADDLLVEPLQPAQLRARVRTWLLRGRAGSGPYYVWR